MNKKKVSRFIFANIRTALAYSIHISPEKNKLGRSGYDINVKKNTYCTNKYLIRFIDA